MFFATYNARSSRSLELMFLNWKEKDPRRLLSGFSKFSFRRQLATRMALLICCLTPNTFWYLWCPRKSINGRLEFSSPKATSHVFGAAGGCQGIPSIVFERGISQRNRHQSKHCCNTKTDLRSRTVVPLRVACCTQAGAKRKPGASAHT
jgi:hypothetical protein